MYTLKYLQTEANDIKVEVNGKWVPARPINWKHRSLKTRFKEAWAVFAGKADCFTWPKNEI